MPSKYEIIIKNEIAKVSKDPTKSVEALQKTIDKLVGEVAKLYAAMEKSAAVVKKTGELDISVTNKHKDKLDKLEKRIDGLRSALKLTVGALDKLTTAVKTAETIKKPVGEVVKGAGKVVQAAKDKNIVRVAVESLKIIKELKEIRRELKKAKSEKASRAVEKLNTNMAKFERKLDELSKGIKAMNKGVTGRDPKALGEGLKAIGKAVESSGAPKEIKELGTKVGKVGDVVEKLPARIQKGVEAGVEAGMKKASDKLGTIGDAIGKKVAEKMDEVANKAAKRAEKEVPGKGARAVGEAQKIATDILNKGIEKGLDKIKSKTEESAKKIGDKVVEAIDRKLPGAGKVVDPLKDTTVKSFNRHVDALNESLKRVKTSKSFETGREDVVNKLEKTLVELQKKEKSTEELAKSVKELAKSVGAKPTPAFVPPDQAAPPVLFGKPIRDLGVDFEKIKRELGQKIVVSIDLETSEIEKVATEFGKKAAVKFISQIAFQKGTIADIMSGKAQKGEIFVKPPKGVPDEEQYRKLIGDIGSAKPIPFEKLRSEGIEATKAMEKLAEVLKDAEVILGQNIKGFDIHVLEQHFEKVGVKIDSAVDKLVDTLQLAREAFPKRAAHSLTSFDEDFKLAGKRAQELGEELHNASYDLKVTRDVLLAVDGSSKELAAAEGDLASKLDATQKVIESSTHDFEELQKASKHAAEVVRDSGDRFSESVKDASDAFGQIKRPIQKAIIEIEDLAKLRSTIQANVFKAGQVVEPQPTADPFAFKVSPKAAGARKEERTAAIFGDLAKSLDNLQNNIITSLEKGMTKGMQILRTESGEAFQTALGGGELELKVVNVRGLRQAIASEFKKFVPTEAGSAELIDIFKQSFVELQQQSFRTNEAMADALYREIGGLTSETAREMGKTVSELFKGIKEKTTTPEDIASEITDLNGLFREVVLEAKAEKRLMEDFIKRLAVPALKIGQQGLPEFTTKFGATRSPAQFATITTGLEKLAKELQSLGAPAVEFERIMREITSLPIRVPSGAEAKTPTEELVAVRAEKLAATLVKRVLELGGQRTVGVGITKAIATRRIERGELKGPGEAAQFIKSGSERDISTLLSKMRELNVSFLDVAKSMDEISFENFYDVLDRLFQAGKVPFLQEKAATIGRFTSSMRDISSVVNDLLGLMPLLQAGRVKRAASDVEGLKVLTRPTGRMRPEEQSKHIINAALLWKDIVDRTKKLGLPGLVEGKEYLGTPFATPLDVSDATSSAVKQLNFDTNKNLQSLDATMTNMSMANLRASAPFKEFSSINRQLSNVTQALRIGGGVGEIPTLVSAQERGLIESGKFGTEGFGLNVITELRNTASTFEDQIVISGRLAKVFTEITQRLIKPAKQLLETGGEITGIEPGLQKASPQAKKRAESEEVFAKALGEVADSFQDILGVPQRYRGRADISEIGKQIETVMREHRGKTIEVQTAKLSETFLNFFGRKFTTRFGTKGVSVTQQGGKALPKDIKSIEDVSKFIRGGFKAGVKAGPGLGVAKIPKSVGELLSQIIEEEAPKLKGVFDRDVLEFLQQQLEESGNKFIIDLFTDASKGLVTEQEAKKQRAIFEGAAAVFKRGFGTELPTGASGIKEIKGAFQERFPEESLFDIKQIEARISSRGIAKRGLMPEILEAIVNNLIGSTAGVTTLSDDIKKGALLETKEARDSLRDVMTALGFETFKDMAGVIERIKFESPNISQTELDKLVEYEKAVAVYTDVVNEFGERVQSLVAPKFLQIVEEPHMFKEATPGEVEKGVKGLKLDFQSMAAMAGVFGKGSRMMRELASSTVLASDQGWELIKTFQALDPTMMDMRQSMMSGLRSVKLSDIKKFDDATGTVEQLRDTIFDIGKFPTAFKLQIPSTKPGPLQYEEFRVPGASLRGTYQEELLGTQAPTGIGRKLSNLISAAKGVEELANAARQGGVGLDADFQRKFATTIRIELTKTLTDTIKTFQKLEKAPTPQNIEFMERTIEKFSKGLSPTRAAPGVYQEGTSAAELPSFESFASRFKGQYSKIFGRLSDILIGANPESLKKEVDQINAALKAFREGATGDIPSRFRTPQIETRSKRAGGFEQLLESYLRQTEKRAKAETVFDIELEAGNLDQFTNKVGISLQESIAEALQLKRESLSKAKIRYFKELGEEVFGKKKGIEQVFFQRVTPAVTGKAISAITDKTDDLNTLLEELGKEYIIDLKIPGLEEITKNVRNLTELHSDFVEKAKSVGLPVLKPGEIGLPTEMLKKIQVRTGEKSEIALSLEELIKKEQDVFVQSVRFPFTGVSSIQPHIARIMEDMVKGPLGKFSIAVPGAPGFAQKEGQEGIIELTRTLDKLKEFIGIEKPKISQLPKDTITLLQRREEEWAKGTEAGAVAAGKLTDAIEKLLTVINKATPTFTSMEQKLDFDGDALFVHTGQVQESRDEIKKHFENLGKDTNSIRTLFRSVFTAVRETDVASLSEMANIFGKKHPSAKGFEFLTKPFIREDVENLNIDEVLKALFTFQPEGEKIKDVDTKEGAKAVNEWARNFVEKQIIPDVARRAGATAAQREEFIKQSKASETGIPELGESADMVSKNMRQLTEELIRRQLWEQKYADAISGQLFKIETGRTVEGISRLARISEIETGFGAGVAGTGKAAKPSAKFLEAFPEESIALGGDPVGEFAARVNEIMRFVIQKGMDVKHAGVEAIGPQLLARIGKKSGTEFIRQALQDVDDSWKELAEFNEQITNQMLLRLGKFSTKDLQTELKRFDPEADVDLDRSDLIKRIIGKVNIEATFEELFRMIQRAAVKGLTKDLERQLEQGPLTKRTLKLRSDVEAAGGAQKFAKIQIAKESISDTGIAISKHIVTNLQPLYKMRTSMETMATAAKRTGIKIDPESVLLPETGAEEFKRNLDNARKAASTLSTAFAETGTVETKGIHKSLVFSAIQQRYKELEELQKLEEQSKVTPGRVELPFTGIVEANKLAAKVLQEAGAPGALPETDKLTEWLDQMAQAQKAASSRVEEISKLAGLRQLIPEEESLIGAEFGEAGGGGRISTGIKGILEKQALAAGEQIVPADLEQRAQEITDRVQKFVQFQLSTIEQLRRVSEVFTTVPQQKEYLKQAFPKIDFEKGTARINTSQREASSRQEDRIAAIEKWHQSQFPTERTKDLEQTAKSFVVPETPAAELLKGTAVETADALTGAISEALVRRKRDALKFLETKARGPEPAEEAPLHEIFRASALKGGGAFGGGTQTEGILKEMLGFTEPSALLEVTGLRGTAIHRQKQKEFLERFPKSEIEVPIEDFANRITGHLDVVYEEAGQKVVADIKTIYSTAQFDRLRQIAEEIEKEQTTIQEKLKELKAADPTGYLEKNIIRRLEDYLSQVNVYLKGVEGAVGKIIIVSTFDPEKEFTIDIGKFDPALFDKDIKEVEKARRVVSGILGTLSVTGGLPPDLLKEYPKIYKELAKKLETVSAEDFEKTLPTRPMGETTATSQEVLGRLTEDEERLFSKLSGEYLSLFQSLGGPGRAEGQLKFLFAKGQAAGGAAAPPPAPPPPGGAGGGGFDDFGEGDIRKRVDEVIARIQQGTKPDISEMALLAQAMDDALEASNAAGENDKEQLAENLAALANTIKDAIEQSGGTLKSFREAAELIKGVEKIKSGGISSIRGFTDLNAADIERINPSRPEAVHKNLIALYEAAIRINRVADTEEIQRFGPDIAKLLTEAAEKGPGPDISSRISQAVGELPPEKKGGIRRIWQFYKKSVAEYFLSRLNALKEDIERESGTPEGRRAFIEYEQVIDKFLANIRGTIGQMSDIFTTTGPSGKKNQFVDEELARLTGIYRSPKQIEELIKQTTVTGTPFKPILDIFTADLDSANIEDIATPLEKVNAAFSALIAPKGKVQGIDLKEILKDADLFGRFGEEAVAKWDFDKLVLGITQLRAGLQSYNRLNISGFSGADYTEAVRVNVEETIKLLKQLEKAVVPSGGPGGSALGLINVPSILDPDTQALLHRRNLAQVQKFFKTPEESGGPERGQAFTLKQKIVDPATKQVLKDTIINFRNIGQATDATGRQIGLFTQTWEDMIASMQNRKGVSQAFRRVINWGIASRVVYGMVGALQDTISTMADVETGIAKLRQVMSPMQTDFEGITQSALDFAKEFGLPIRQVIDSMRVFAQQGLSQAEVIDRTRTSMLAANVTTLTATDATEAITAATKVYRQEGESTIRFLDSWTEVEARHAITSGDLANAMKKAAAVARTAGVTFDQFNGIVTGIGETSRQTGKEIGTSLRFMFRRLTTQKAPEELEKLGIPVRAESGKELRGAFDILGDLSTKWTSLTNAQKLNIATAIGGRRHYNSLIILMDHWDDVLETINHSMNSKGAAERRNMLVMETYAKRLQQVREAMTELQVQFGKLALPVAKVVLAGLKGIIEVVANIPAGLKIAALGFSALFVVITKGASLIDGIVNRIRGFVSSTSEFGSTFAKQFKIGIFETFGKLPKMLDNIDTRGLSTIMMPGKGLSDFESVLGKLAFTLAEFGRSWNSTMSEVALSGVGAAEAVGNAFGKVGSLLSVAAKGAYGANPLFGSVLDAVSLGASAGEGAFLKLGKLIGIPAIGLAKWSAANASFVKSMAPLAGTILAFIPIAGKLWDATQRLALSADDYEKSQEPLRRKLSEELSIIRALSSSYKTLEDSIAKSNKARDPGETARAIERGEYVSPVLQDEKDTKKAQLLANTLSRFNSNLVSSFDSLGNAVLKPTINFKNYFKVLETSKVEETFKNQTKLLGEFSDQLTNAGTFTSIFRSQLKKFVTEVPAFGEILAKGIKVSPAQQLEEATADMNKILRAKSKFPLTTAFDELFERYFERLASAKSRNDEFIKSFKRVLSELTTAGLSASQIGSELGKKELRPGFELLIEAEPRLKKLRKTGGLDVDDLIGSEILKKLSPEVSLDYAAPLTKELLRQAGVVKRSGEAFAGDIVLFTDQIDKKFNVAGRQGILRYKEGLGFFVEAIDKELRTAKNIPFTSIEGFVDSIFPAHRIIDEMDANLDILETALTGAAAGLVGLTDKEFKKSFNLGQRFFEQLSTTTLLQTEIGFNPVTGKLGRLAEKSGLPDLVKDFFIKPTEELATLIEGPSKRLAGGGGITKGIREDIEKLMTVIKNNQVVIQFHALLVDLNKSFADSSRVLQENIAIEQNRNEVLRETAGLLAGIPESFTDLNTGVRDFFELSSQQRILFREQRSPQGNRPFTDLRKTFSEQQIRRTSLTAEVDNIVRTIAQLRVIMEQADRPGVVADVESAKRITEAIVAGATPAEGRLFNEAQKTAQNTGPGGAIVSRLDDILAAGGDRGATERQQKRQVDFAAKAGVDLSKNIEAFSKTETFQPSKIQKGFAGLEQGRVVAIKQGNTELVRSIDVMVTSMTRELVSKLGFTEATKILPPEKLISQGIGGAAGLKVFIHELQQAAAATQPGLPPARLPANFNATTAMDNARLAAAEGPPPTTFKVLAESDEFKQLLKVNQDQKIIDTETSNGIAKLFAISGAITDIARRASRREQARFELQAKEYKSQQDLLKVQLEEGKIKTPEFRAQFGELEKQRAATLKQAGVARETAEKRATLEAITLVSSASVSFARALGISETLLKAFGTTAFGAIIAWNAWSTLTGEKTPEIIKKATGPVVDLTKKMIALGKEGLAGVSLADKRAFQKARQGGKVKEGNVFAEAGAAAKSVEQFQSTQKKLLNEAERSEALALANVKATDADVREAEKIAELMDKSSKENLTETQKIVKTNEQQVDLLLEIAENTKGEKKESAAEDIKSASDDTSKPIVDATKQSADSMTKAIRDRANEVRKERLLAPGTNFFQKFRDGVAAAVIAAAGGFLAEKGRLPSQLGEGSRQASSLNKAVVELGQKFPVLIGNMFERLEVARKKAIQAPPDETTPERRSRLLNVKEEFNKVMGDLSILLKTKNIELGDFSTRISQVIDQIDLRQQGEFIAKSIDDFAKVITASVIDLEIDMKRNVATVGALSGLPSFQEIPTGKLEHELTPTERLMKEGGKVWQGLFRSFQNLHSIREGLINLLKENAKRIVSHQVTFNKDIADTGNVIAEQRAALNKGVLASRKSAAEQQKTRAEDIARVIEEVRQPTITVRDPNVISKVIAQSRAGIDLQTVAEGFIDTTARDKLRKEQQEKLRRLIPPGQKVPEIPIEPVDPRKKAISDKIKSIDVSVNELMIAFEGALDVGDVQAALETRTEIAKIIEQANKSFLEQWRSGAMLSEDFRIAAAALNSNWAMALQDMKTLSGAVKKYKKPVRPDLKKLAEGVREGFAAEAAAEERVRKEKRPVALPPGFVLPVNVEEQQRRQGFVNQLDYISELTSELSKEYFQALDSKDIRTALEVRIKESQELLQASKRLKTLYKSGEISFGDYGKAIGAFNQNVIAGRQDIELLSKVQTTAITGPSVKPLEDNLSKSYSELALKAEAAAGILQKEIDLRGELNISSDATTKALKELSQVFLTGLNISDLVGDFDRLKQSFKVGQEQRRFQNLIDDVMNSLRGGSAPDAPIFPSIELLQTGVSMEDALGMTRADQRRTILMASQGMISAAQEQQIQYEEVILPEARKAQGREDEKLRAQLGVASQLDTELITAIEQARKITDDDTRNKLVAELKELRAELRSQAEKSGERVGEISPGVFERVGLSLGVIGEKLEGMLKTFTDNEDIKQLYEKFGGLQGSLDLLPKLGFNPIVTVLSKSKEVLDKIAISTELTAKELTGKTVSQVLEEGRQKVAYETAPPYYSGGGSIRRLTAGGPLSGPVKGPGTKKSDSIYTSLAPESFVINAKSSEAARKALGTTQLAKTMSNGRVGLAPGGLVPVRLSNSEEVFSPDQVKASGGMKVMESLNRFPLGGLIPYKNGGGGVSTSPTIRQQIEKTMKEKYGDISGFTGDARNVYNRIKLLEAESSREGMPAGLHDVELNHLRDKMWKFGRVGQSAEFAAGSMIPQFQQGGETKKKKSIVSRAAAFLKGLVSGERKRQLSVLSGGRESKGLFGRVISYEDRQKLRKHQDRAMGGMIQRFAEGDKVNTPKSRAATSFSQYFGTQGEPADRAFDQKGYEWGLGDLRARGFGYMADYLLNRFGEEPQVKTLSTVYNSINARVDRLINEGTIEESAVDKLFNFTKPVGVLLKYYTNLETQAIKSMGGMIQKFQGGGNIDPRTGLFISERMKQSIDTGTAFDEKSGMFITNRMKQSIDTGTAFDKESGLFVTKEIKQAIDSLKSTVFDKESGLFISKELQGINSFGAGTSFVPNDQIAMLHKGEAVVPAAFNKGEANPLKSAGTTIGKEIEDAIKNAIADASITIEMPDAPQLELSDAAKEALSNVSVGSVGAAGTSKLDQFIEASVEKFDRLEDRLLEIDPEKLVMLNTKFTEIEEIQTSINNLETQIDLLNMDVNVKLTNERSYVDTRIGEVLSDFKTAEINPLKARMQTVEIGLLSANNRIEDERTFSIANFNRLDLGRS